MTSVNLDEQAWTEDKCIQLILQFRARPLMWDHTDTDYFKKKVLLKQSVWEEIGRILNMPAESCKRKMNVLLSSYRREKSRVLRSIKLADDDPSKKIRKSSWVYFKYMAFLMDKDTEKRRLEEDPLNVNSGEPSTKLAKVEDSDVMSKEMWTNIIQKYSSKKKTDHAPESVDKEHQASGSSNHGAVLTSEYDEEIHCFTTFVASKMKRYKENTKNAVQQKICQVLFRADQNFYENVNNEGAPAKTSGRNISEPCNENSDNIDIKEEYSDSDN